MPANGRITASKLASRCSAFALVILALAALPCARAGEAAPKKDPALEAQLRHDTQMMLDAIAPGDAAVWDKLLDPAAIQVDENDVVRGKAALLAELKPIGPGLVGHLYIDDFRVVASGDVAIVTHEDNETLDYHGQMILSRFRMTDTWHKTAHGWRLLAEQEIAVLKDPPPVVLDQGTLCSYAGQYALTADIVTTISCSGNHLVAQRAGRPDRTFLAEVKDVFFEPGQPRTRRMFLKDAAGRITGFVDRREARDILWKKEPA